MVARRTEETYRRQVSKILIEVEQDDSTMAMRMMMLLVMVVLDITSWKVRERHRQMERGSRIARDTTTTTTGGAISSESLSVHGALELVGLVVQLHRELALHREWSIDRSIER